MESENSSSSHVVCPNCSVQYPVDARAIAGASVRCKRCGHVFTAGVFSGGEGDPFNITRSLPVFHDTQPEPEEPAPPAPEPSIFDTPAPAPAPKLTARPPRSGRPGRNPETAGDRGDAPRLLRIAIIAAAVLAALSAIYLLLR